MDTGESETEQNRFARWESVLNTSDQVLKAHINFLTAFLEEERPCVDENGANNDEQDNHYRKAAYDALLSARTNVQNAVDEFMKARGFLGIRNRRSVEVQDSSRSQNLAPEDSGVQTDPETTSRPESNEEKAVQRVPKRNAVDEQSPFEADVDTLSTPTKRRRISPNEPDGDQTGNRQAMSKRQFEDEQGPFDVHSTDLHATSAKRQRICIRPEYIPENDNKDTYGNNSSEPIQIEYEDISAEVEARVRLLEERRKRRADMSCNPSVDISVTGKRKRNLKAGAGAEIVLEPPDRRCKRRVSHAETDASYDQNGAFQNPLSPPIYRMVNSRGQNVV